MPSASRAVTVCGVVVAVLLAPAHTPVAAQAIPIGAHLRVRAQGNHAAVFSGRLRMISNDSIALALDDDAEQMVPFAFSDIGRVEMEHHERTRDEAASAMGAVGAVGGLTAAVYWCVHNQSDCADDIGQMLEAADDDDESNLGPSGLMVLGGALLGSALGYLLAPQPHWELVVFPTRTATSNGSTRLLMNVGVSIPLGGRGRR